MTQNQIAYWRAVEDQRHNLANEGLDEYKFNRNLEHEREMQAIKSATELEKAAVNSKSLVGKLIGTGLAGAYTGGAIAEKSRRGETANGTLNQVHLLQPAYNTGVLDLGARMHSNGTQSSRRGSGNY